MLVKHNLCPFYKFTDKEPRTFKSGKYEIKDGMIEAESLTDDNYAVIQSFKEGIIKGAEYSISFTGYLETGTNVLVRDSLGVTLELIDKIGSFKYNRFYTASRDYLAFECYVTDLTRFNLTSIIVNKGKQSSDVYLPNINTLPQDKQPLLPPEGDYKEIQAR